MALKKYTNYAAGARGITVRVKSEVKGKDDSSDTVWVEPGETVSIDPTLIVEPLPDLGTKPPANDPDEESRVEALESENAELRDQVEAQGKELTALRADLEKATKLAAK